MFKWLRLFFDVPAVESEEDKVRSMCMFNAVWMIILAMVGLLAFVKRFTVGESALALLALASVFCRQLGAQIEIRCDSGTAVRVRFSELAA